MRPFLVPIVKPCQVIYDILRNVYGILVHSNGETSRRREIKKFLREVQGRIDKKDADLQVPPNPQDEKDNLGEPQSTVKFMGIFAWLNKRRLRAPKKGANGSLPR